MPVAHHVTHVSSFDVSGREAAHGAREGHIMTSYEDQMEQQADGEFTAELRRRKAEHDAAAAEKVAGPAPTFRVTLEHVRGVEAAREVNEYSYTRYSDAAAHFWGFVQLQPDDGWDFFGGGARPASANPYDLDRRGRDFTRNDAPWSAELKVIA